MVSTHLFTKICSQFKDIRKLNRPAMKYIGGNCHRCQNCRTLVRRGPALQPLVCYKSESNGSETIWFRDEPRPPQLLHCRAEPKVAA